MFTLKKIETMSTNDKNNAVETEAIAATETITKLLRKYLTGDFIEPEFFPQGEILDQFKKQNKILENIYNYLYAKDLSINEKEELDVAVLNAVELFRKLAEDKIELYKKGEMLAVYKNFMDKKRKDNG